MKNLDDYSGKLVSEIKLGDFSPDTRTQLLALYSKLYLALDGFWYLTVKDRVSNQAALDCDIGAWEKLCKYEMKHITGALNITGKDVNALMKAMQITPWFQNNEYSLEINGNKALLTMHSCATLNALEKEGTGREKEICNLVDPIMLKAYASYFDPRIEVKCLKSPPRQSRDEICCRWEFTGPKQ